jgi:hypothetical protein
VSVALAGCSSTSTVESTPGQQRPSDDEVLRSHALDDFYLGRHGKYHKLEAVSEKVLPDLIPRVMAFATG